MGEGEGARVVGERLGGAAACGGGRVIGLKLAFRCWRVEGGRTNGGTRGHTDYTDTSKRRGDAQRGGSADATHGAPSIPLEGKAKEVLNTEEYSGLVSAPERPAADLVAEDHLGHKSRGRVPLRPFQLLRRA